MPKRPKPNGTPGKKPPAVTVKETAKPKASTTTQQVGCTIHAAPDDYSQGVRAWK
jgi:hypothetical protein